MVGRSHIQLIQSVVKEAIANPPPIVPKANIRFPPLPSPRELLNLYNIKAQRHLSQNFILDPRLLNKIVTKTGKVSDCHVCEVGPGPGNISRCILQNGATHLTVIEKDKRFIPALQLLSKAVPGKLRIISGDIMDFSMETIFPKELAREWNSEIPPLYIIGNLPFNISTPLIIRWMRHLANRTGPFSYGRTRLSLTFQKEVAERMVAGPRRDMRCRLSVMCQYLCNVELLFTIPGRAFFPKPEVDVSLVKFTPLIKPKINHPFKLVEKVMRTLFHGRQKHIIKGIKLLFPENQADLALKVVNDAQIDHKMKAMELEMYALSSICDIYSSLCKENEGLIDYDFRQHGKKKCIKDHTNDCNSETLEETYQS